MTGEGQSIAHCGKHRSRNADAARLGEALEARRQAPGPRPALFWIEGYYIGEALGDEHLMAESLARARAADPMHPALEELGR